MGYYSIAKQRKLLCCIGKLTPLPFESEYKIEENEVNNANEIVFSADLMDDNDEKSVLDTMEQSMDGSCLQIKKKKKYLVVGISMDDNNEIAVSIGKEKVLFEFDEEDNDDDNDESGDDDLNNNTDTKTSEIDGDDTIDID